MSTQQTKYEDTKDDLKKKLLESLERTLGVVTTACKLAGIARSVHYRYYEDDPVYRAAVDDIQEITLDFVESQLHKKIKGEDTASIIFYMKTKGRKRGYIERIETNQPTLNLGILNIDPLYLNEGNDRSAKNSGLIQKD